MEFPGELKYSKTHEWVKVEGDVAAIGITEYASEELGDIVYVELPEPGRAVSGEEVFGTVESVKAVSDLVAPVAGVVTEINAELAASPEQVNVDPYGKGWLLKIKPADPKALDTLMDSEDYASFVEEEGAKA